MKNKILIGVLAVFCLMLSACKGDDGDAVSATAPKSAAEIAILDGADVLEIGETMFLSQINDLYFNLEDYEDKTVVVEGMYGTSIGTFDGISTPIVYRFGPGCCGDDGQAGFILHYDGELPEKDDWIRVIGTPELGMLDQRVALFLNVLSLEVKKERGIETVMQ